MGIFAVKTFANCPKTEKFVKVFNHERFPLYGIGPLRTLTDKTKIASRRMLNLLTTLNNVHLVADTFGVMQTSWPA